MRRATRTRGTPQRQWAAERRDPTAATTQLRWHGRDRALVPDWDAAQAIRLGYLANVVAYRCVCVIADTIAARPFRAGLAPPERPGEAVEHNPQARLARLLGPPPGGPTHKLSAQRLWAWTIAQRLVTGRYGWEIETTGPKGTGEVVALWPLTSQYLKAIPSADGASWWSRFEYGRPEKVKHLTPAQVHYGWSPLASDFRQPHSPLQAARYALANALATDKHTYGFLSNGAVPAHVVGVEAFESADEFAAFKRRWGGDYAGPENSGKTHFVELKPGDDDTKLSEALFIQTVGTSAKDSKLPETYRAALEQVAMSLGVPWSRLDASGRTYDNAREEDASFWRQTLLPLASELADEVNMGLAPRLGPEVGWFDLSDEPSLQPIPPASAQEIPALIQAGVVSADEARPWLGLTGPAPEAPDEPEPVVDPTPDPTADEPPQQERGRERRATADQEARRLVIWRSTDAEIRRLERSWVRAWRSLFATQASATLARLEGNARSKALAAACRARVWSDESRGPADGLFDPAFWRGRTEAEAEALFADLADSAFVRLTASLGVSFDLEAEFARDFIRTRSNQLAGEVTDTTYRALTSALAEGVAAGDGIPALADRVREVFEDASQRRATVIARTEVLSGHNAAAMAAATSLPGDVVAGAQWIATRDGRTRATHAAADGQIVGVGQPFSVGGSAAAYPGDPALPAKETVQCRCAVAFLTPDEFEAEAAAYLEAQKALAVPVSRARVALALVAPGRFDESRFRAALEMAA